MKSTYARFLSLARLAGALPGAPVLDPTEERLLQQFASFWGNDYLPRVLEALALDGSVSRRTVQRRIDDLRTKGMIRYVADPDDPRVKRIAPTELTERYFERFDQLLNSAVRSTQS